MSPPPGGPRCCCRQRHAPDRESGSEAAKPVDLPQLPVASYTLSRRGSFSSTGRSAGAPGHVAIWDAGQLRLSKAGAVEQPLATVAWANVSKVWACVRTRPGAGFFLEVALETRQGELDFLRLSGPMEGVGGQLLEFLQTTQAERLGDGRPPVWVMSRWAVPLYHQGFSSNKLRVFFGWTTTVIEVVFALCFLLQVQRLLISRGDMLLDTLSELSGILGRFGSLTTSVLLLQHLMAFLFIVRSFWSTVTAALRSLLAFQKAAGKARKSIKRIATKRLSGELDCAAGTAAEGASLCGKEAMGEGELRQRGAGAVRSVAG